MINNQKGMTFLEVLVALVILVTGILGSVAMQASAKKGSFDAMQRSLASSLAQDIIERMRNNDSINPLTLDTYAGTYGDEDNPTIATAPTCDQSSLCNPAQMVTNDLFGWEQALMGADVLNDESNAGGLINAQGCIIHANNSVTIVISWEGRIDISDSEKYSDCGASGSKRRQVMVEAFVY